jgi:two-component system, cell cycle response regulator
MQTHLRVYSVAWHAPGQFHPFDDVRSALSHYSLNAKINESITGQEDITLFYLNSTIENDAFITAYQGDSKPTLLIVGNSEQEVDVFRFLKDGDDICRSDVPLELIAARLDRILRRFLQVQLENLRRLDPLTGVLSRWAFKEEIARYSDPDMSLTSESRAIVLLDLDWFKKLNDHYGHGAGDEILHEVGRLLLEEAGPEDRVGRYGGEEFILVLSRYNTQTILDSVERIRQRLADHEFKSSNENDKFHVTASFGVAMLGPQSKFEESLSQADMAMYQAKQNGRNNVVCFDAMLTPEATLDQDIHVQHFENVTRVVTERVSNLISVMGRRLIETARQEANVDALTQLHNRRYFDNRLSREFEMAKKHGRTLTVALMDIDNFHGVNTTFGWPTGDHVLRIFSKIASENIRLVDWLARYGGEEFCLVMLDTELVQGVEIAERIRTSIAASDVQSLDNRAVNLTVSIGVATLTDAIESPVSLIQQASKALIFAKEVGRNRVHFDK